MQGFLQMLERQKKREHQVTFDLSAHEKQAQWKTMQKVEEQVMRLYGKLNGLLPGEAKMIRSGVYMQAYREVSSNSTVKIKTQVSAYSRKKLTIKVHCHQVDAKGKHDKLARVVYEFVRSYQSDD